MTTLAYLHDDCRDHLTPQGHPERPARHDAVLRGVGAVDGVVRREAPLGADDDILRCHPQRYVDAVEGAVPAEGTVALDPDTHLSPGSVAAARRAVGGVCAAVDAVLDGSARNAFVGCRPPGHHAERETAMGFCLFGTAAIGAVRALDHHGLGRVAVLDFDVHHGNGTQDLLWDEARAFFASSHQMPLFPGTGAAMERGAHGQIVNVPLGARTGGVEMRRAWEGPILAALEEARPELILVSAGFDAHMDDPLASLMWQTEDFAWLTARICDMADDLCEGRVVSTLEGGYDLAALEACVAAHLRVLEERGR
ncbi:histone deacetylase family protein [Rhodobacteraceae bacterium CCMM004]|nr:histone deacetylase family protein [Rhodobacteraceae bacterium CCMM004]